MTSLYRLIRRASLAREAYQVAIEGLHVRDSADCRSDQGGDEAGALESAFKAGYEAGRKAAGDEMRSEIDARAGHFTSMIDDLESQRRAIVKESEAAVLKLACEIARKVIGDAVETDESVVKSTIASALKRIDESQRLVVRLNPDDLTALRAHHADWVAGLSRAGSIEIKEDQRIKRGGCLVDGESGIVEAQVERQIEIIDRALQEATR
jgi:flagellar assembly protein FliH